MTIYFPLSLSVANTSQSNHRYVFCLLDLQIDSGILIERIFIIFSRITLLSKVYFTKESPSSCNSSCNFPCQEQIIDNYSTHFPPPSNVEIFHLPLVQDILSIIFFTMPKLFLNPPPCQISSCAVVRIVRRYLKQKDHVAEKKFLYASTIS